MTGHTRRRPVPKAWRDEHHRLRTTNKAWGHGFHRASRTKGTCSCGASWPGPGVNNLNASDVKNKWLDHVEEAYYTHA